MNREEYFEKKIELSNGLLEAYKEKEAAETLLIDNLTAALFDAAKTVETPDKQHLQDLILLAQTKIDRFETKSAIVAQQFNIDELVSKRDKYIAKIENYRIRMADEWENTLNKIKQKILNPGKYNVDKNQVSQFRLALDRANQPFDSEEEQIEYFMSLESISK